MLAANFLLLAAVLFCIGVFGVIARRNAVMVLMSIELVLNAVNLNLIAFALMNNDVDGQVFALFVIAIAAAEVGVGLAHGAADLPQPPVDLARRTLGTEGLTRCSQQKQATKSKARSNSARDCSSRTCGSSRSSPHSASP